MYRTKSKLKFYVFTYISLWYLTPPIFNLHSSLLVQRSFAIHLFLNIHLCHIAISFSVTILFLLPSGFHCSIYFTYPNHINSLFLYLFLMSSMITVYQPFSYADVSFSFHLTAALLQKSLFYWSDFILWYFSLRSCVFNIYAACRCFYFIRC